MSRRYIAEFKEGELIDEAFLVRSKELRETRSGGLYIRAELADRTGSIEARMWDASEQIFESFQSNDFVKVRGRVEVYKGRQQLRLDAIRYLEEGAVDLSEFVRSTLEDPEELLGRLRAAATEIKEPNLMKLVLSFLEDESFVEKLKRSPAAVSYHHPFLGGLLEHTANVVKLADFVSREYPTLDRDLMLAGAILHDIGKVEELTTDRSLRYTDRGELVGHVVLGALMVEERANRIEGFPKELLNVIEHVIVSHHGEREFGSPKVPLFPEAIALHLLDNLDAKIFGSTNAIERDTDSSSNWTAWSSMLQRRLYKGPAAEPEDD